MAQPQLRRSEVLSVTGDSVVSCSTRRGNITNAVAQGSLGPNNQSRNPRSSMHAQESWIAVAEVPQSQGAFSNAQNFIVNNSTFNEIQHQTHDTFMETFAKHTIRGATVDSSARDPPPRCHPGTRLSAIEETRALCAACPPPKRLAWIVGPAGVGKSAIMQTVAETSPNIGAAIFFSVNGRNDSTKAITTLAYQLATRFPHYLEYIRARLTHDPTIFDKAIPVQFNEFITEPFANRRIYRGTQSLVIFIDGVDECDSIPAQRELLKLISQFIAQHPSIPLLWITASRPEPHITSFFKTLSSNFYDKTELSVDSNQSCADVEKYLRDSFAEIQSKYPSLQFRRQWPTEHQLIKIVTAARGLFAFGSTAVRFVDDPKCGNPESQLQLLLETIDNLPTAQHDELDTNPMAPLYALYDRVMSCIPRWTFLDTVKLLYFSGILPGCGDVGYSLGWAAEWLRMTPEIAYGCVHHLHSVLHIPPTPENAAEEKVEVHHKSFKDYLAKKYPGAKEEFEKVALDAAVAILKEISQKGNVTDPQPWECLMLCWPNHNRKEHLYRLASGTIQSSKLTCSRTISRDSDTIQALRVMTPYMIDPDYLLFKSSLGTWLTEDMTVVHVLKEVQVFQPARVGNIDLDRIWKSWEDLHVLYLSKYPSQVSPRTQAQIVCNDYSNRKHGWGISGKKGNHYLTMRSILGGKCRCLERIKNDLMNAQANTPDTIVATWTGGDGWGLVIYDFVDPDNQEIEWRYIMPCAPPGYRCL